MARKFFVNAMYLTAGLTLGLSSLAFSQDEACKKDFEKLCPELEVSVSNTKKCFANKKEQLSESCRKYYEMISNPKAALKGGAEDNKKSKEPSKTDQVKAKAKAKKNEVKDKLGDIKDTLLK